MLNRLGLRISGTEAAAGGAHMGGGRRICGGPLQLCNPGSQVFSRRTAGGAAVDGGRRSSQVAPKASFRLPTSHMILIQLPSSVILQYCLQNAHNSIYMANT